MEFVCPLCNGLDKWSKKCLKCGGEMIDRGPVVDYMDEYSPYLSNDITQKVDGACNDKCVHIFKCIKCSRDKRFEVKRVKM
ncbi:MAG: hypothetical protein FH753_04940 [Firmicutes bacterium]|nr:hypothetical protein [Bacillota bacterium]